MEYKAIHRYIRMSPKKVRYVADLVRGKDVNKALNILRFNNRRGAYFIEHLIKSAVANVSNTDVNLDVDIDSLYVSKIMVDEGPRMKRWMPRAMGRATPIIKRSCHISVVLEEKTEKVEK